MDTVLLSADTPLPCGHASIRTAAGRADKLACPTCGKVWRLYQAAPVLQADGSLVQDRPRFWQLGTIRLTTAA